VLIGYLGSLFGQMLSERRETLLILHTLLTYTDTSGGAERPSLISQLCRQD
jgi:hypothetical protein